MCISSIKFLFYENTWKELSWHSLGISDCNDERFVLDTQIEEGLRYLLDAPFLAYLYYD